jgi:hypothetical protein
MKTKIVFFWCQLEPDKLSVSVAGSIKPLTVVTSTRYIKIACFNKSAPGTLAKYLWPSQTANPMSARTFMLTNIRLG